MKRRWGIGWNFRVPLPAYWRIEVQVDREDAEAMPPIHVEHALTYARTRFKAFLLTERFMNENPGCQVIVSYERISKTLDVRM